MRLTTMRTWRQRKRFSQNKKGNGTLLRSTKKLERMQTKRMDCFLKTIVSRFKQILRTFVCRLAKPTILFESLPDFADNTMPVYEELCRRGYGKKYYLIWIDKKGQYVVLRGGKPVSIDRKYNIGDRIRQLSLKYKTRAVIACNRYIHARTKGAVHFYLSHGTPIKDVGYYPIPAFVDYSFCQSGHFLEHFARAFHYDPAKTVALGYPRNDVFLCPPIDSKALFATPCHKVIVWYPTFRQQRSGGTKTASSISLPILHDPEAAERINTAAAEAGVLIVLKPHFSQDVSLIRDLHLSNITFIGDEFFEAHRTTSYQFVGGCDALLTDYSSIYFDYLLRDKPIGAVFEDIEEYRIKPGFALDVDYYLKGAEALYTVDDLAAFIRRVSQGEDLRKAERAEIRSLISDTADANSTARVTDFITTRISGSIHGA